MDDVFQRLMYSSSTCIINIFGWTPRRHNPNRKQYAADVADFNVLMSFVFCFNLFPVYSH